MIQTCIFPTTSSQICSIIMALLGMEIHQTVMADDGDVWVEKERGKLKLYEMRE